MQFILMLLLAGAPKVSCPHFANAVTYLKQLDQSVYCTDQFGGFSLAKNRKAVETALNSCEAGTCLSDSNECAAIATATLALSRTKGCDLPRMDLASDEHGSSAPLDGVNRGAPFQLKWGAGAEELRDQLPDAIKSRAVALKGEDHVMLSPEAVGADIIARRANFRDGRLAFISGTLRCDDRDGPGRTCSDKLASFRKTLSEVGTRDPQNCPERWSVGVSEVVVVDDAHATFLIGPLDRKTDRSDVDFFYRRCAAK